MAPNYQKSFFCSLVHSFARPLCKHQPIQILMNRFIILSIMLSLFRTTSAQTPVTVVKEVDLNRYMGTWYEIARLPNSFERGLKCTTATYELRDDGRVTVINRGVDVYDPSKTDEAKGVAWIPDPAQPGKLKVRFFWPFSGDYWIIDLDPDYQYVLVGSPNHKYLWVLARTKFISDEVYLGLLQKAKEDGFELANLIKVSQYCD